MKTDDLIAMLATNVEPVDRRQLVRTIGAALLSVLSWRWVPCCSCSVSARTCTRTDAAIFLLVEACLHDRKSSPVASFYLTRLARPGGERKTPSVLVALPFLAIVVLAGLHLTFASDSHWKKMIVGDQWLECLLSIPIIAIVPFAAVIWALRRMAPTDLTRTGALAGLVAAASAQPPCVPLHGRLVAVRCSLVRRTIALCTLAGADARAATSALVRN